MGTHILCASVSRETIGLHSMPDHVLRIILRFVVMMDFAAGNSSEGKRGLCNLPRVSRTLAYRCRALSMPWVRRVGEHAINEWLALEKDPDPQVRWRLWRLHSLILPTSFGSDWMGVKDVTRLRLCTSLQSLSICGAKELKDVSALAGCYDLRTLNLQNTGVTNLSGLTLTQLRVLDIRNTPVASLEGLRECHNLLSLNLFRTMVTDISLLQFLTNLQVLDLSGFGETNVLVLAQCADLWVIRDNGTRVINMLELCSILGLERQETCFKRASPPNSEKLHPWRISACLD